MFDISKIRSDFPILSRMVHGRPLTYLDSAATAQKPQPVIDMMTYLHAEMNANVHRGVHYMSEETTSMYEAARERVRSFIGAGSTREIIFTSGATASINLVAYSFGERFVGQGSEVIVSEMEHHSNIVPWQLLCERKGAILRVLPFDDEGRLLIDRLDEMINDRTAIIAVTEASNVLGTRPDLAAIIAKAHSRDIPVLVDGCQGVVHNSVNVSELDCDFYAFSGHKLYAPTGIGVLYAKERWLAEMPPFMGGGDMVDTVTFSGTTYADLPLKFEAGTSNYAGAICMGQAMEYLGGLPTAKLHAHEQALMSLMVSEISQIDGLRIYGTCPDKTPLVSFTVDGIHPYDIGMILDKMGVAVRTGTHCAEPIMQHYGITGMVRASLAIYNDNEDVSRMAEALKKAVKMLRP